VITVVLRGEVPGRKEHMTRDNDDEMMTVIIQQQQLL